MNLNIKVLDKNIIINADECFSSHPSMYKIVLKHEITIIKKILNTNVEDLKNYGDVHEIDENSAGRYDMIL